MDQAKSLWIQQSYELLTVIKEEPDVETLIQFLAAYYEVMKLAFFFCFEREYSGVFFISQPRFLSQQQRSGRVNCCSLSILILEA